MKVISQVSIYRTNGPLALALLRLMKGVQTHFERRYYAFLALFCLLKGIQTYFEKSYYAFFRIIMPFERRTNAF